ncbi:MAG: tripartite tricarboxylate transporter TctB family protein [Pseudomonadota bacterium]
MSADRLGGLCLLAFCIAYASLIPDIPSIAVETSFTARSMPTFLAIVGTVLAAWLVIKPAPSTAEVAVLHWQAPLVLVGLMIGYGLLLRPLGLILATTAFLWLSFLTLGAQRRLAAAVVALVVASAIGLLLTYGLGLYLNLWPAIELAGDG